MYLELCLSNLDTRCLFVWTNDYIDHLVCVIFQNLFNKPTGMNSSVVPLSQGQVIVSIPTGSTVSSGGGSTSAVSPTSISSSAAAGLQRLAAQSQHVGFTRSVVKLKCQHCNRLFATKPELLDYKVKYRILIKGLSIKWSIYKIISGFSSLKITYLFWK